MDRQNAADGSKRIETQTSVHLLMAGVASVFSVILILLTLAMSWEMWMVPLIAIGLFMIWGFHIGGLVSGKLYENFGAGILLIEFFYYGVHAESIFEIPIVLCMLLFMLALLGRRRLLYLAMVLYIFLLLYHALFLRTICSDMPVYDFMRLGTGLAGAIVVMLLSGYSINRRKISDSRYRRMAEQLESARRQNADFLSNISHELRTPINMVMGISEVALEKDISPEFRESMQSIQRAGKRLAGQINDILDYTEVVGNTLAVTKESYMLFSIVNDVATMAGELYGGSGLEIVFDMDVRIPAVLIGDAEKLSRVLKLLLQNAVKFTREGGIYVHIGCRRESYGVNLDIEICDTGIGMTASQLLQIYDDFYQADTGSTRYSGGLGLGIPIARGLLHGMDGFIYYESLEGQGTQVHITIPQGISDDAPGMAVANPEKFCVVCYLKQGKYKSSRVRDYYDTMISHLMEGLGIEGYRVYHFEDLEKLRHSCKLTHLLIAQEEYEENSSYYEGLGKTMCVVLVADRGFTLREDSSLRLLHKPLFGLSIVNLLNGETGLAVEKSIKCAGVRALVADDEEMNLVVARGILESYGMHVDTCLSGEAAVKQCAAEEYDVVFLDHMMPGLDGIQTLKRIREIKNDACQNMPIIALTANAISGAREMFKGEGFTEFVPKPIERHVLERALRGVLPEQYIQYSAVRSGRPPSAQEEVKSEGAVRAVKGGNAADNPTDTEKDVSNAAKTATDALSPVELLRKMGINVDLGMVYCGGMEDFYLEMMQMYSSQCEEKKMEMLALYEAQDWKNYAIKVHALKSTSLTIGAEQLSEDAKSLELAGKAGDEAYIKEHHQIFIRQYESICRKIAECTGKTAVPERGDVLD